MTSEGIPVSAAKLASLHAVTLLEREDDFLATSDKLTGQEFEGATPASALNAALAALGVEERFDPAARLADSQGPLLAAEPIETLPGLNKGKKPRVLRAKDVTPCKTVAEAVAESPKEEPGEEVELSPAQVKAAAKRERKLAAARERENNIAAVIGDSRGIRPPTKAEAKAAEKAIGHAPENAPKSKAKDKTGTSKTAKPEAPKGEVVNLADKRKEKAAAKPVTKAREKIVAKAPATPAPAAKPAEKAKAKTKVAAKAKEKKVTRLDGPDNGNGRKRGTRWFLKEIVLKDPALGNDDVFAQLAKQGINSTLQSVGSIRLDFMATLRAAKGLNKLADQVAKRVPDAKASARKSTAVLKVINEIIIEHPAFSVDEIKDALKTKVEKAVLQTTGVTGLSATRAAIIESLTVMREGKALR